LSVRACRRLTARPLDRIGHRIAHRYIARSRGGKTARTIGCAKALRGASKRKEKSNHVLKWIASGAAVVAVGGLLIWAFLSARGEQSRERERERAIAAPQRVARGTAGEMIVSLDPASRQRIGLQVAGLPPTTHQPELVAAGALQEDPSRTFTLRAPIAGALRVSGSLDWPRLGVPLADGSIIGAIEPRIAPTTKIDLESRSRARDRKLAQRRRRRAPRARPSSATRSSTLTGRSSPTGSSRNRKRGSRKARRGSRQRRTRPA
jgi:hypothetical protein